MSEILFHKPLDSEDKTSTLIQGSGSNYKSKTIIINKSGLYSLILGSKLPTKTLRGEKNETWKEGKANDKKLA